MIIEVFNDCCALYDCWLPMIRLAEIATLVTMPQHGAFVLRILICIRCTAFNLVEAHRRSDTDVLSIYMCMTQLESNFTIDNIGWSLDLHQLDWVCKQINNCYAVCVCMVHVRVHDCAVVLRDNLF